MPIFELKPKNEALDKFGANQYKDTVIVRAKDEDKARVLAQENFGLTEEKNGVHPDHWQNDKLVICKQLDNSEYKEEGPEEILFPKSEQL